MSVGNDTNKGNGWLSKGTEILILIVLSALLYKAFDFNTTLTQLKGQINSLTSFIQRKFPRDYVPNVVSMLGLHPLDDSSFVFAAQGTLTQETKTKLRENGYVAVPVDITPDLRVKFGNLGPTFNSAYYLMRVETSSPPPETVPNLPQN